MGKPNPVPKLAQTPKNLVSKPQSQIDRFTKGDNMVYGYARTSTSDKQTTDLQVDALLAAGCDEIIEDQISGAKDDRPGLNRLLQALKPTDSVIVWKLDRLGRSVPHLLSLIQEFQNRNVTFRSLTEVVDTSTPSGKFLVTVLCAVSEMERGLLIERCRSGIAAAKLRGRVGGRPSKLTDEQIKIARQLLQDPQNSTASIIRSLGISKSTFYRTIKP